MERSLRKALRRVLDIRPRRWRNIYIERQDGKVDHWGAGLLKHVWGKGANAYTMVVLKDGRRILYPPGMVKAVLQAPIHRHERQEPVVYG